jgi:hypothetical protein
MMMRSFQIWSLEALARLSRYLAARIEWRLSCLKTAEYWYAIKDREIGSELGTRHGRSAAFVGAIAALRAAESRKG